MAHVSDVGLFQNHIRILACVSLLILMGCQKNPVSDFTSQPNSIESPLTPYDVSVSPNAFGTATQFYLLGKTTPLIPVMAYSEATCQTLLSTTTAKDNGFFSFQLVASPNSTQSIYVQAKDNQEKLSRCLGPFSYTNDQVEPAVPLDFTMNKVSPGSSSSLIITGKTEADSQWVIFSDSLCHQKLGESPTQLPSQEKVSATIPVLLNQTQHFYALAKDKANNASTCVDTGLEYTHDNIAPLLPVALVLSPQSPAKTAIATLSGQSESQVFLEVFTDSTCTAKLSESLLLNSDLNLSLTFPGSGIYSIYLKLTDRALNGSGCLNTNLKHIVDLEPPQAPILISLSPLQSQVAKTQIKLASDPGVTIDFFSDAACADPSFQSVQTDLLGGFDGMVDMPENQTTHVYMRAKDEAGNTSACVDTTKPFLHDNIDPAQPLLTTTNPFQRGDSASFTLSGTLPGSEGATVSLYSDGLCSQAVASQVVGGGQSFGFALNTSQKDMVFKYFAKARDNLGNESACTTQFLTYETYSIPVGVLHGKGYETTGTPSLNLNQGDFALKWDGVDFDSQYFGFQSSNSNLIRVLKAGSYTVNLTLPTTGDQLNTSQSVRAKVLVNGLAKGHAIGESGFIFGTTSNFETSVHLTTFLKDLNVNDEIQIFVEKAAGSGNVQTRGATLFLEAIDPLADPYMATATTTTAASSTNFNFSTTGNSLRWADLKASTLVNHSDSVSPDIIYVRQPGMYYLALTVPLSSTTTNANVKAAIYLQGNIVNSGWAKQGYISNTLSAAAGSIRHTRSSLHWVGLIDVQAMDSTLAIRVMREGATGTVTSPAGAPASLILYKLPSSAGLLGVLGTQTLSGGDNHNVTTASALLYSNEIYLDTSVYTHDAVTGSQNIVLAKDGDYALYFNNLQTAPFSGGSAYSSARAQLKINGLEEEGKLSSTGYMRIHDAVNGLNNESSLVLGTLLRRKKAGDIITTEFQRNGVSGTINGQSLLYVLKKPYKP